LDKVDQILIPNPDGSEFANRVQNRYLDKVTCVGDIVREPDPKRASILRRNLKNDGYQRLVALSFGGGGSTKKDIHSDFNPKANLKLGVQLARQHFEDRFMYIAGPYADMDALAVEAPPPNLQVISVYDDIPSLFAASDLSIATVGYNTANELRASAAPAILMPRQTIGDDQHQRAKRMEDCGQAIVATSLEDVWNAACSALASQESLLAMKEAAGRHILRSGAANAAKAILELAGRKQKS
jgi:UDP-N-acetylglucosamine:LPS N-acetylglucosamine transferase